MMAIEAVAGALISGLLAPMAKSGVEALSQQVGEALGAGVADSWGAKAKSAWARLREKFSTPWEQAALEEFDAAPEREDAQVLLKMKLAGKLEGDPDLAADLRQLLGTLEEARAAQASTGAHVENVTGDVGIADARQADFRGATNPTITGLNKGEDRGPEPQGS